MPVSVAVIGAPGAGKTTLFNALTGGRGADGVGMVDVPDGRLQLLAGAVHPKKIVPAQVRVADAPPGSRAQRIAAAREADVVIKVARCFGPDPDPAGELEGLELDLALTDLATVDMRIEIVGREVRAGKKGGAEELAVLELAKAHLDEGQGLRSLNLEPEQRELLKGVFPVSDKPSIFVANVADSLLPEGGELAERVRRVAAAQGAQAIVLSAQLELELAELEPADAGDYRATYGLTEASLGLAARAVWDAGGLITYFTAGEPEVRAWPCIADASAPVAAGVIHSDFEKHFIRVDPEIRPRCRADR